ncbi:endonuclease domain-containing protein, partial [Klebsiella pneumoniae]|uniref:endonuclease domain-containing protein n=1 Tax=Klebsiella pneumoniae TaxID=573 RepID=UPI001179B081
DAAKKFVDDLYDIIKNVKVLYSYIVPMEDLQDQQTHRHTSATHCYLCKNPFTEENHKVRDHDHLTEEYRGPACNACNINYKLPHFIPVVLNNLSGYDAHFIIPQLG